MKPIVIIAILFSWLIRAGAQIGPASPLVTRSFSGQFVAYPSPLPYPSRFYSGNADSIPIEPGLLVVSCERIKQGVARILDSNVVGKNKIYLHLRSARLPREPASIGVQRVLNEWVYHVDVPDSLEQKVFVRTLVQVVLMEMANRNSPGPSAEIPLWLSEGITQELLASEKKELLLPINATQRGSALIKNITIDERRQNPLEQARNILNERAPLTFEQLSWPAAEQFSAEGGPVFRSSAQLFVNRLLQLKNGPACLQLMLNELPRRYNWQFAFLDGFKSQFQSLLEIEKWWALQLVEFTGRDLMQAWTPEESWTRLEAIVRFPVETRARLTELPQRTEVSLQNVIYNWDAVQQRQMLQRKLQELNLLRPRTSQNLIALVDDYRNVIATYLRKQNFTGSFFWFKKQTGPIRNRLAETTIKELNALDAKLQRLHPNVLLTVGNSRVGPIIGH